MRRGGPRQRIGPFASGLIAIAIIVTGVWLAFAGLPFQSRHEIRAVFSAANELHPRTPVRLAGVEVGRVKKVERGEGTTAIVTLSLKDSGLPVHADAVVKVRPRIFLEGNFFLDLHPGTPSAPVLEEGDVIPLAQTAGPVQLDQVLSTFPHATREQLRVLVDAYATALGGGGAEAVARAARPARGAFAGAAQLAEASRGEREGDLAGFVRDGGRTSAALASDERALAELVTGLTRTSRGLASRQRALARSVAEIDLLTDEAGPALAALNDSFPPLRRFLGELRPALRRAPAALSQVPPLVAQLDPLLARRELPALRRSLQELVPPLARVAPVVTDVLRIGRPIADCLRDNAIPTLNSTIEDPPHSSGAKIYQELLWSMVGLGSASQNFDGNGPNIRYHAGFGDQVVTTGEAPTSGERLVGLALGPIIGSRPAVPAVEPPFRPDVDCRTQEPPNLRAATGPAPAQYRLERSGP